jgi:hypothetical protein
MAENTPTAPEPILAPTAGNAPTTTTMAPTVGTAPNGGAEMTAREPWNPPTSLQLQESLRELTEDKGRHTGLIAGLNANPPLVRGDSKLGKFLIDTDWKNVVWAAQAWLTVMGLPEELEQQASIIKEKEKKATARKLAYTAMQLRRAAGRRAARIWNPKNG